MTAVKVGSGAQAAMRKFPVAGFYVNCEAVQRHTSHFWRA